jgi:hypothetical protein
MSLDALNPGTVRHSSLEAKGHWTSVPMKGTSLVMSTLLQRFRFLFPFCIEGRDIQGCNNETNLLASEQEKPTFHDTLKTNDTQHTRPPQPLLDATPAAPRRRRAATEGIREAPSA